MKYILFACGQVGAAAVEILLSNVKVEFVFIEKEHAHESIKYYEEIERKCKSHHVNYAINADNSSIQQISKEINPDYIMSFGYRRMINPEICATAKRACIGSHFAPLPRYRGFAPLNWVLINGETETAVNTFFLDASVDAGNILQRESVIIEDADDINTLTAKCVVAFKRVLLNTIEMTESGCPTGIEQDHSKATYTCSRSPDDGEIDWGKSSRDIYNLVRALTYPMPGAFTYMNGEKLYVWKCRVVDELPYEGRIPGRVIQIVPNSGVKVLSADGSILIEECSLLESERKPATEVIKSMRLTLGK